MCHNTTFAQIIVTFEAPCDSVRFLVFASGATRNLIVLHEINRVVCEQTPDPLTGEDRVLVTNEACDFVRVILDFLQTGLTKSVEARQHFRCRERVVANRATIRRGQGTRSRSRTGTGTVF